MLAACLCLGAIPASGQQTLSPSDPAFWVVLPDGGRVPYNHPLAARGRRQAPTPRPAAPVATPSAVLTPADPGFWVTLPNGAMVPYNHPDAFAAGGRRPATPAPGPAAPVATPSAVLTPADPGFWVTLPNGAMVPYNHPDAIAAAPPTARPASPPAPPRPSDPEQGRTPAAQPQPDAPPDSSGGVTLRVLQWNLHHGVGTDGKYDIERIASWMAKMKPDVIMLNEVEKNTWWGREDQPARYEALMEQLTGRTWYGLFAQEFGDWAANGKGHLILSIYPFESTAREAISYDRAIGAAGINVNGRTVSLLVTHLDPESQSRRLTQAREVSSWAANLAGNRILTGDMNAWPDQASIGELNKAYRDSWTDAAGKGRAMQFSGLAPDGATRNGRIDYIFYSRGSGDLSVLQSEVYDTRDSSRAMPSDHRPVVTTFTIR